MRVAAVAGSDIGHLLPVVAVAVGLRDRGHDVTVVAGARWRRDVEHAGCRFRQLPQAATDDRDADLGWRLWGRGAVLAPALAAVLGPLRVDHVVADSLTATGGFAAELLDRPWTEVVPHWLAQPSKVLPPVGLGALPTGNPLRRLSHRHLRRRQRRSAVDGRRQRAEARRRLGLSGAGGPTLRLVATLPALEPSRPDWPPHTFVVGALSWEPPSWPVLEPPRGDEPLVVVSDTTASGVERSLVERALPGLRSEPVRVVATTVRSLEGGDRVVVGRGRHTPLLERAACAVGTAGGGFVAKALTAGIPLVAVPLHGDQLETAARVVRARAGLRLRWADATPDRIRDAVATVIGDHRYRDAARRAAHDAAGLGRDRAAELIEHRGLR
ncbi:MAG: glycosyltransferase [Actinobacteria bacterium]|nr:glycosyltransferase [Actinomycetota bacterium]